MKALVFLLLLAFAGCVTTQPLTDLETEEVPSTSLARHILVQVNNPEDPDLIVIENFNRLAAERDIAFRLREIREEDERRITMRPKCPCDRFILTHVSGAEWHVIVGDGIMEFGLPLPQ